MTYRFSQTLNIHINVTSYFHNQISSSPRLFELLAALCPVERMARRFPLFIAIGFGAGKINTSSDASE